MSGKIKHPRDKALEVARELTAALRDQCEPDRFIFAGSLRRMKPEVGDIELVYVPKFRLEPDGLFDERKVNVFDVGLDNLLNAGVIRPRENVRGSTMWGPKNKLAVHLASGIGIDFFAASEENFWTLLVCRTGSAESNMRVCQAAERMGQKWNPYRGFEDRSSGDLLFVPGSERSLFEHVGMEYLQPKERV